MAKSKDELEDICLDDLILDFSPATLKHTLLWKRLTEEHGHAGCCCCCCCCCCNGKESPRETPGNVSIDWANPVIIRRMLTSGRTLIVQAWLNWTATAPLGHTVTIAGRIRDHNGSTVQNWKDFLTGQPLTDDVWYEIGRVNSFFSQRRYRWDFRATLLDSTGNLVAQADCPLDAYVDPTPSLP